MSFEILKSQYDTSDKLFPSPGKGFIQTIAPLFRLLGLNALPLHLHGVIISFLFFHTVWLISKPIFSSVLRLKQYRRLSFKDKIYWDAHVVSMVHAVILIPFSFVILKQNLLNDNKIFGYSPYAADIYSVALGYFLWDTVFCTRYVKFFGKLFMLHGISSASVFILCFRPLLNYYGPAFILYELSTPFVNMHWFFNKTGMAESIFAIVNGICLTTVFFFARIIWGWRMSYEVFSKWNQRFCNF